ncbi:hypothetical protein ACHWQZ_G009571 [Mnemiopsis leidyi]
MKIRLFRATVESVLLYGSETWTISQAMAKRINGSYSRMSRMALNIRWPNIIINADLFGSIPFWQHSNAKNAVSCSHIARHDDILADSVLFWDPNQGHRRPGRPHLTYVDMLRRDTGLNCPEEIRTPLNLIRVVICGHGEKQSATMEAIAVSTVFDLPFPKRRGKTVSIKPP